MRPLLTAAAALVLAAAAVCAGLLPRLAGMVVLESGDFASDARTFSRFARRVA